MLAIPVVFAIGDDVSVCAEGLHEALSGAAVEEGGFGAFVGDVFPEVEEFLAFFGGVVHVGIKDEGGEVVFLASAAQALEVDEIDFVVFDHEVLRLEIAMDEMFVGGAEGFGDFEEGVVFLQGIWVFFEVVFDEVIEEVALLPAVEVGIEGGHEFEVGGCAGEKELVDLF